jgi:hypothetical protein
VLIPSRLETNNDGICEGILRLLEINVAQRAKLMCTFIRSQDGWKCRPGQKLAISTAKKVNREEILSPFHRSYEFFVLPVLAGIARTRAANQGGPDSADYGIVGRQ